MDKYPFQLKEYYFIVQSVRANPEFNPHGDMHGTKFHIGFEFVKAPDGSGQWLGDLRIGTDEGESINPSYFCEIQVFGVFASEPDVAEEIVTSFGQVTCYQVLIGAIRERLATLTSRGPWGPNFLNIIPIKFEPQT